MMILIALCSNVLAAPKNIFTKFTKRLCAKVHNVWQKDEDIPCILEAEPSNPQKPSLLSVKWMDRGKPLAMQLRMRPTCSIALEQKVISLS